MRKIKDNKIKNIVDLEDEESIKIAIIKARVQYNLSLPQALVFIIKKIEKQTKDIFSETEIEELCFYLLQRCGLI